MAFNKGKSKRKSEQEKQNKSRFEAKSITRVVVSLFVAVAAFIGATYYESYLLSDKNVTSVVVATADIKKGMLIDETNVNEYFKMKEVNSSLVSKDTLQSLDDITGKTSVDITKGEIITSQRLIDISKERDRFKDPVIITYAVTEPSYAVGGSLREGDIVDIMEVITDEETGKTTSQVLIEDAYILTAWDNSGNVISRDDTAASAMSFAVYVEREEEENFNPAVHTEISMSKVVLSEE